MLSKSKQPTPSSLSVSFTLSTISEFMNEEIMYLSFFHLLMFSIDSSDSNGIKKVKEYGQYSPKNLELTFLLGQNYEELDITMRRYIWLLYIKRLEVIFFEKPFKEINLQLDFLNSQSGSEMQQELKSENQEKSRDDSFSNLGRSHNKARKNLKLIEVDKICGHRFYISKFQIKKVKKL